MLDCSPCASCLQAAGAPLEQTNEGEDDMPENETPSFKEKIHKALIQRMTMLEKWTTRDAGGSLYGYHEMWREVKYWREAIERGEFDE